MKKPKISKNELKMIITMLLTSMFSYFMVFGIRDIIMKQTDNIWILMVVGFVGMLSISYFFWKK